MFHFTMTSLDNQFQAPRLLSRN